MTTTATDQISAVSVVNMLGEIVDGHEDYVNRTENCMYVYFDYEGHPSCIVGHVFAAYGYDYEHFGRTPSGRVSHVIDDYGLPFTLAARYVLDVAQSCNDNGYTWGHAYARATQCLEGMRDSESP